MQDQIHNPKTSYLRQEDVLRFLKCAAFEHRITSKENALETQHTHHLTAQMVNLRPAWTADRLLQVQRHGIAPYTYPISITLFPTHNPTSK
jgi:hypothetical protein